MNITNKGLALVLLVAVAVSFSSTLISLNRLDKIEIVGPTARAPTDTGTANLTIQTDTSINFDVNTIDFGTGFISGGVGSCRLDTNGTSNTSGDNSCAGGFNLSASPFVINNTGNNDAQLDLRSNATGAQLLGGSAELEWWLDESDGNACTGEHGTIWSGWATVNTSDQKVCNANAFLYDNGGPDTLDLHIRINVTDDVTKIGVNREVLITGTAS